MEWLYKISITCFAASYLVVFALEISRVFFDASIRKFVRVTFATAGLFAHTVYLIMQGMLEIDATGIWLNSWFAWCLATAWVLAAAYLWISVRQSKSVLGLFLLPAILVLIAVGIQFGSENLFTVGHAKTVWSTVHGSSLLLGTAVVVLGFVFGVVYLIQANRLKRKLPQSKHFRLPSLEWLQKSSETSLVTSTVLLAVGLISGIAINLIRQSGEGSAGAIAWTEPVIWTSAILFLWLLTVSIFSFVYQPARQGRKVAYLVVTCFLFLVLELVIVWRTGHAVNSDTAKTHRLDAGKTAIRQASLINTVNISEIEGDKFQTNNIQANEMEVSL